MKIINIGKDFSDAPLGRYPTDGPYSGEKFRDEILHPALKENAEVTVDLDDAEGFGSSFLEEAFGGLVRKGYFTAQQLQSKLKIQTNRPSHAIYRDLIWTHIRNAHCS